MLTVEDRVKVEDAVRRAEETTAGEIVVIVARRAGSYKSEPLVYGLLAALLTPWPLMLLTDVSTPRIFSLQAMLTAIAMVFATWLGPNAAPRRFRAWRARTAAAREFASRGMTDTRGRTGVLLYVALAEHYAEVLGDVTVAERVDEGEWRRVIETLLPGIGRGERAEALVAAVDEIGAILARHIPPETDDRDELPNRVVLV